MTRKENIRAILECYFTGFKDVMIDSACERICEFEQEPTAEKSVQDMTELEKALLHIKTRADAWAVKVVKDALSKEPCEVSEYDKDHIWYKGGQYISLRRFLEVKAEAEKEPTEKPMCDRNICISNEYNGIGCDECIVNQEPCDKCVYSTKDGYCQYDDISETIPPLEPCTDAVSRKAVLDIVNNPLNIRLDEIIKKLPSVTQKSGKWLYKEITDDYRVTGQCSECKERRIIDNFCPNCGAKMESEVNNG